MKVLLINPLYDPGFPESLPPLGLASLASVAEKNGHEVKILDLNLKFKEGATVESSVSSSLRYDADVIGLTCWGNTTPFVIEFCKKFKSIRPETKLVIGGEYASFKAESILKESAADFVVRGEGEETFVHLLHAIESGEKIDRVFGISYRESDKIVSLPDRPLIDMDNLPFINWGIIDNLREYKAYKKYGRLPYQASRGCPFRCIFCSVQRTWGGIQRRKSPRKVIDEIKYFINEFGARQLDIRDDTFTLNKNWVIKICKLMLKENIEIDWRVSTRIDLIDRNLLNLMKKAGCKGIFYGVEHISPKIQRFIGSKFYTADFVEKKVVDTIAAGMDAQISVIFGWPVSTRKTAIKLSQFCQKIRRKGVWQIHIHLLFPLPGTRLVKEYSSAIVPNPYPKLTQPGLKRVPQEYYALLKRHSKYVPDFWMFRSKDIEPNELLRIYADTKLMMVEENIRQLSILGMSSVNF